MFYFKNGTTNIYTHMDKNFLPASDSKQMHLICSKSVEKVTSDNVKNNYKNENTTNYLIYSHKLVKWKLLWLFCQGLHQGKKCLRLAKSIIRP